MIEILFKVLKSRTVWAGILSLISLIVYFKTGYFIEVSETSPDITTAIESVSLFLAILGQVGVMVFRLMATAGYEKNVAEAEGYLDKAVEGDPKEQDIFELIKKAIEILRKK